MTEEKPAKEIIIVFRFALPVQKYDAGVHVRKASKAGAKMIDKAVVIRLSVDGSTTNRIDGVVFKAVG